MGIYDRDYMRRRPDEDRERRPSPAGRLDTFFGSFLRRHPRLPRVVGITFVVLIIIVIVATKLWG